MLRKPSAGWGLYPSSHQQCKIDSSTPPRTWRWTYGGASADLQPSEELVNGRLLWAESGTTARRRSQTSTSHATDQDSPFVEADHDLTKPGETTAEKVDTLINKKDRLTIYIPPGDYTVTKPLLFKKRIFLFGPKDNKPTER